ncbi:hypothetical protein FRB94_010105 [Tulasnella sp. JGI-2019a]|nr:hypothetical protein FRB94_010105 [Tulasnella sp. JGI-2019a]
MAYYANSSPPPPSFTGLPSSYDSSSSRGARPTGESLDDLPSISSTPPRVEIPSSGPLFREYFAPRPNTDPHTRAATEGSATNQRRPQQEPAQREPIQDRRGQERSVTIPAPSDPAPYPPQRRPTTGNSLETYMQANTPISPPLTASTQSSQRGTMSSLGSRGGVSAPPSPIVQKCLLWDTIFHPSFIKMEGTFQKEWQFEGLYTNHILFSQIPAVTRKNGGIGKKVLIYDINTQIPHPAKVKYHNAGLGPDANYILCQLSGEELHMYDIAEERSIKSAQMRNLSKWTYNAIGFCMVDSSGKFWRWSFHDRLPPTLVFRLVDRAPRQILKCLTTRDGAWNAIVATDRDRTRGEVHCYPTDNDEARIYKGVLGAFTQTKLEDGPEMITFIAIVNLSEDELSFSMNQLGSLAPNTIKRVETKMPISAVGGSPSAMFIDHKLSVAVVLVAPTMEPSSPTTSSSSHSQDHHSHPHFIALLFDLRTGTFLMKQDLTKVKGDSWIVDDTGLFRETAERGEVIVQKLKVIREALSMMRIPLPEPIGRQTRAREGSVNHGGGGGRTFATMPVTGLLSPQSPGPRARRPSGPMEEITLPPPSLNQQRRGY